MLFAGLNGRRISLLGILLFCFYSYSSAQVSPAVTFPSYQTTDPIGTGTVRIIAAMVEFQPDDNRFTSGDGTFEIDYLRDNDIIIDPLPHDQGYFEAHLEFVQNYFNAASFGALNVEFTVLPEVFRLDNEMKEYSPTGPDNSENFRLANLAQDTWQKVAESGLISPDDYLPGRTMFVIFHAGAGRDIELTGTTLDNTPQDIPSVYLSDRALRDLLNAPDFDGFQVADGVFVRNTGILPQTQSRRGEDVTGAEFVLELSINGILTATVGSFLGIPDLFNTESGRSGIGRFGLMDGAGIFSYYGLFPPLPSAWERIYMGWDLPFDITLDDTEPITLPAVSSAEPGRIARHRVSSDEYFLVENRHRDPDGTGVTVTIRTPDGEYIDYSFDNSEERFNPFDQSDYDEIFAPGVLTNISNFDWSLPGGLDLGEDEVNEDDNRELNGGMLIWHIDEAVIRSNIGSNSINNNPDRGGVILQEADGAQDIGRPSTGLTSFESGGPFDFWWSGNDFTVILPTGQRIVLYENRFAHDTFPNNRTNTGSRSYFEFYDFSDNLSVSSFRARPAAPDFFNIVLDTVLPDFTGHAEKRAIPIGLSSVEDAFDDSRYLIIPTDNGVYYLRYTGDDFEEPEFLTSLNPTAQPYTDGSLILAGLQNATVTAEAWRFENGSPFLIWDTEPNTDTPPTGLLSSIDGETIELDGTRFSVLVSDGSVVETTESRQSSGLIGGEQAVILNDRLFVFDQEISLGNRMNSDRLYAGMLRLAGNESPSAFLLTDEMFEVISQNGDIFTLLQTGSESFSIPALIDLDDSGTLDFLYADFDNNILNARNKRGGTLWNFPVDIPVGLHLTGSPIVADIFDDGRFEILIPAADSLSSVILGYDDRMRALPDFPLYAGSLEAINVFRNGIEPFWDGQTLFVTSPSGDLKAWRFDDTGNTLWSSFKGNDPRGKILGSVEGSGPAPGNFGLLNKDETYNWPNPANSETYIRYQTSEQADISITVTTMSGNILYERSVQARGGVPEEVLVNTSSWSNGVYFARVKATANGRSETRLIKIAVMH